MSAKPATISVESLRPLGILYPGDLYDLACLLLRLWDAKDQDTNSRNAGSVCRSRPTVNGLATHYSRLVSSVDPEQVREVLQRHGLPLGAVVDNDPVREVAVGNLSPGEGTSRR